MERWWQPAMRLVLLVVAAGVIALVLSWQRDTDRCEDAGKRVALVARDQAPRQDLGREVRTLRSECVGHEEPLKAAAALLRGGHERQALGLAREAVREEPENYRAWLTLAAALRSSDPAGSRRALARARQLNPRYERVASQS